MKVGFATVDWSTSVKDPDGAPEIGGAGHYRMGLPAKYLAKVHGIETALGTLIGRKSVDHLGVKTWDGERHFDLDVLVVQRYMNAELVPELEGAVASGQVVLQDVDDWFFGLDPKNRAFAASHPKTDPEVNRNHYRKILARSSGIIVSTPYLAERLGDLNRCEVVPNAVEMTAFEAVRGHHLDRLDAGEPPTIGWVGATPFRSGDLETLKGIMGPFLDRHDLAFHHSGHVPGRNVHAPVSLGLDPSHEITVLPMAPIRDYPALFAPIDVGLVPLRDAPFNRAKSWIKGLEYAAAAVPFVAQDLPAYQALRAEGIGLTARRPKDWPKRLGALLDPEARLTAALDALDAVYAHHRIEDQVSRWVEAFTRLAS